MYENGERVKGFATKRFHKRIMKRKFIYHRLGYMEYKSYADYLAHTTNLSDRKYWRRIDVTDIKHYSKKQTNQKIRRSYSKAIQKEDYDNLSSCRSAEYQKYFADWWWEL
jgi:hypothetical protein